MILSKKNARILIVDDDEDDFIIIGDYIQSIHGNSFQIEWGKNFREGINKLSGGNYDMYFVDYRLGIKNGVDFLEEAEARKIEVPGVLLTGKGNYEVDIKAMKFGAVDYLVKTELSSEKLERCIRYALERAEATNALKNSELKYRNIFEKSKDVFFVADEQLNIVDINHSVFTLLGYDITEVLKMNLVDWFGFGEQREFLTKSIQLGVGVTDLEIVLMSKNGEKKYCIITLTLEQSVDNTTYLQGIIHDITHLKKAEKATLQAEKLAAAGRLVRTIAHEVRNPLNNITLSVDQMRIDARDENLQQYFDIILRNGKRISDLISELLYTSRPTENTLERQILQNILDDVIEASVDRITLKNIKLQISYPDAKIEVLADREKLMIALLNIVINAIEAMNNYEGRLFIALFEQDDNAVVVISDNGCGISEENISKLFEPYFTQKRNGVGLGLTFTLNILQAHKATVEVSSIPGVSTTFTITIPLLK